MTESAPTRSRRPALVVFLIFFLPLAAAFVLIYSGVWRPSGNTQHGDLIDPARPLPQLSLHDDAGKRLPGDVLQHYWSLLYIGDGQCDERCRAALADMQRARELLGKDMTRVQSVLLASGRCCDSTFLHGTYPKLIVVRADEAGVQPLLDLFPEYDHVPRSGAGRIYIVDPHGNLMMSYPSDASGIGMYEDLKKLLSLSHIG